MARNGGNAAGAYRWAFAYTGDAAGASRRAYALLQHKAVREALGTPFEPRKRVTPRPIPMPPRQEDAPLGEVINEPPTAAEQAQQALEDIAVTPDRIVQGLSMLAFSSLDQVVFMNENRLKLREWSDIPLAARFAIRQISVKADGGITIMMHDKRAALVDLARIHKMLDDEAPPGGGADGKKEFILTIQHGGPPPAPEDDGQ